MTMAKAHVPTTNAAKYLQQLCKHWSHRLRVELQEGVGTVHFPDAVATMTARSSDLVVSVEADDEQMLDLIKGLSPSTWTGSLSAKRRSVSNGHSLKAVRC
jgi:uncharacterized protein